VSQDAPGIALGGPSGGSGYGCGGLVRDRPVEAILGGGWPVSSTGGPSPRGVGGSPLPLTTLVCGAGEVSPTLES
jgi:hypothetical protein